MELPDFHIPHAEKIEWMIETHGWALEAVVPDPTTDPPTPASAYSIGMREAVDFPDVAVFGLAPAASNGLITLVADACRGGTQIPLGAELVGLLDNELRCVFAPIDPTTAADLFDTAVSWFRGEPLDMVQLIYPDRNGFLPYEVGFDQRMRLAQPIVGQMGS
ncbi:DUF4262 domain-containing protein [Ilumatobacter nonamiensis]|uniref:DUF4262 domain-containing protein n=1 Tax=Ilumatobacter nonamiensis TaxID=467093 RepID=UPI00130E9979|nr:DUF4262 domain-containing protein [Ilumatobacter nonamiensis]